MLQIYNACKLFFFPTNCNNRVLTEIAKTERGIESIGQSLDAFLTDDENKNRFIKKISARLTKIEQNVDLILKNVEARNGNNLSYELREERVDDSILKKRPVGEEEKNSMQPATKYQCIAPEENPPLPEANPPPAEASGAAVATAEASGAAETSSSQQKINIAGSAKAPSPLPVAESAAAPAALGATAAAASGATAAAPAPASGATAAATTAATAPKRKAKKTATSAVSTITTAEPRTKAAAAAASTKKTVSAKQQRASKVTRSASATAGSSSVEAEGASSTEQEITIAVSAKAQSALSVTNAPTAESAPATAPTAATTVASLEDFISNVISSNMCTTYESFGPKFCGNTSDCEYAIKMLTGLGLYHRDFKVFIGNLYKDYVKTGNAQEETYRTVLTTRFGARLTSTETHHTLQLPEDMKLTPVQLQKMGQNKQKANQIRTHNFIKNISSSMYTLTNSQ